MAPRDEKGGRNQPWRCDRVVNALSRMGDWEGRFAGCRRGKLELQTPKGVNHRQHGSVRLATCRVLARIRRTIHGVPDTTLHSA